MMPLRPLLDLATLWLQRAVVEMVVRRWSEAEEIGNPAHERGRRRRAVMLPMALLLSL